MDDPPIQINLFGGFELRSAGRNPVHAPRGPTGDLLAYLAIHQGRAHPREELCDLFWPDEDVEQGRKRLRQALYILRQLLSGPGGEDDPFICSRTMVRLNPQAVQTDKGLFDREVVSASQSSTVSERILHLERAVSVCTGPLLPGLYHDALVEEQRRNAEERLGVLRTLALAYEEVGAFSRAIECARRAVALDPLREEAHCELMRLLSASGQPSAVTRQYRELERVLDVEIGESPSATSRALHDSLRESGFHGIAERHRAGEARAVTEAPVDMDVRPEATFASTAVRPRPGRRRLPALILCGGILVLSAVLLATRPAVRKEGLPRPAMGGNLLWATRFRPGSTDRDSEATAIAIDRFGNTYVCGFVQTQTTDVDFLTLKYGPDGSQLWQARYDGPSHDVDRARCLALGDDYTVYVAGDSDNGHGNGATRLSGLDYALVKMDNFGTKVWDRRYNGPDNGEDRPCATRVCENHDIVVTGTSSSRGRAGGKPHGDIATVTYSPDGLVQWVRRFDNAGLESRATDMDTTLAQDIVLAGVASHRAATGTHSDLLTILYDLHGHLKWVRRVCPKATIGGSDVRVGCSSTGDVYVAGTQKARADAFEHILVVKYDRNGSERWRREAGSAGAGACVLQSLSVGGNVVSLAIEENAGAPNARTVIARYDAEGRTLSSLDLGAGSSETFVRSMVAMPGGGLVMAGSRRRQTGQKFEMDADYRVAKYRQDGSLDWERSHNSQAGGDDMAAVAAVDPAGNVTVTGQSHGGETRDILTVRFSP